MGAFNMLLCMFAVVNIVIVFLLLAGFYPILGLWIAGVCAVIVFGFPFFDFCDEMIFSQFYIKKDKVELSYGEKTFYLSFFFYQIAARIFGLMGSIIAAIMLCLGTFLIWIVSGKAYEGTFRDFLEAIDLSKVFVKVYKKFLAVVEHVFEAVIDAEFQIVKYISGTENYMEEEDFFLLENHEMEQQGIIYRQNIKLARRGDAKAQVIVGQCDMKYGNYEEGISWFQKAASQKEATAYSELGCCYMEGRGVAQNIKQALQYYRMSVECREPEGICRLAEYYMAQKYNEKAVAAAIKLYQLAAQLGNAEAQAKLGICFLKGEGVARNEKQAFHWLQKAAESKNFYWSGYYLAKCYIEGIGIQKNEQLGFEILRSTVEQGSINYIKARELLAECYREGIGTTKKRRKAEQLLNGLTEI